MTVRVRRGRRWASVKRCVRRSARRTNPGQIDQPAPPGPPAPPPLFDPPGQRLDGEAAKPFLQRYLLNSRFTTCPQGWGVGGCSVEERYSHHADTSFYYCRLTPTSGADIRSVGSYTVMNATVNADGSWGFDEIVDAYGTQSAYEWHVATNGVVTGYYRYGSNPIQQLGPLQYAPGSRDCGY